jgi:Xaa-Pro dipeptidase
MNIASIIPGLGWTESIFGKKKSYFQLAKGKTLAIPMDMHKANRYKVCDLMKSKGKEGVILLKGGEDSTLYDTDAEVLFKQDSWFNYLFGAKESGCYATIEIASYKTTLFIPRLTPEYEIWCGKIHPPSYFKDLYDVDEVLYVEDLTSYFNKVLPKSVNDAKIYLLEGVNSDSGIKSKPATFENDSLFDSYKDTTSLFNCLATARVTKSELEIIAMRYCALVASNAHVEVMRTAKEGMHEYELEAKFLYEIYRNGGCRRAAYNSICACGPNGAILHYGHANAPNDRKLKISDMALLDMGAEYHGYVSDITCSFPIAGTFSDDQKVIYQSVLNAQRAVLELMKPGVEWPQCHLAAEKEILTGLAAAGILVNGSVDDFIDCNLGATFFPHGLGHIIG